MLLKNIKQFYGHKYGRLCLLIVLVSGLVSCRKFLDEKQKSSFSLIDTPKACMQVLDYAITYTGFPLDGLSSSDEYYLTDADFDALLVEDRGVYVWDPEMARTTGGDWLIAYKKVYSTNVVLESLTEIARKNSATENTADFKLAKGFALFMRAYNFFTIAQIYAPPYKNGAENNELGIPLRFTSDINAVSVRSTVKETYNQIIKDLRDAIQYLPETTLIATRPDKSTAYAFLARVYLAMGDYPPAGEAANSCLSMNGNADRLIEYSTISKTSVTPFTRFMKEVLFHTVSPYSRAITRKIDSNLYRSYDAKDLRKVIFFKPNAGISTGTYFFTGNYEPATNSYFTGIGIDEVYLIRAECYARANKPSDAMNDLNTLLSKRWDGPYANRTAADADDALNQVLTERKKELVMRDLRWSDLRRLNQDPLHKVTIKRKLHDMEYVLEPNENRYTLLFPQDVIQYSNMPQNQR